MEKIDLTKYGIDEYREGNLRRLAAFLMKGVAPNRVKFDMARFSREGNHSEQTTCQTAGCAVGWNTFLIPKVDMNYRKYSLTHLIVNNLCQGDEAWNWCFGASWSEVDNTPEGASKRILWLLDKGLPSDHSDQLIGYAPLCYI